MPDIPGALGLQCGDCGAHFQLDPAGSIAGAACSECGGKRFFRSQPSPTQSDGTLRDMVDSDSQHDEGGNPLNEGTIVGGDGEKPSGLRDNYMHSKVAYPQEPPMMYEHTDIPEGMSAREYHNTPHEQQCPLCRGPFRDSIGFNNHLMVHHPEAYNTTQTVAKGVEPMRTSNMEPYAPLWDESYLPKTAGPLAEMAAPVGGALLKALPFALPSLMRGALGHGGGQQAGGMAPDQPDPAPSMGMLGSTDIPFLLVSKTADMDTPHSVKTVDEQHDEPEKQDQKEFNDEDNSPSNFKNPNNEDSGMDGEDGVRDATEGYGLGENSPSVERAMMILPLLMHYFQSEESGQSDPLIRGLHDALEKESPGYMDNEHPDSHKYLQIVVQNHKPQQHVQAGVNAFPGGLPTAPSPGAGMQNPGGGTCPSCGGTLAGDGSCPQCGAQQHPQGGAVLPGMGGPDSTATNGGTSYPPNRVANGQGPVTPEQFQAARAYLQSKGQSNLMQDVLANPHDYGWLMAEIQNQPNTPPQVDPSQAQPAPPQAMMDPSGGMPVNDPSQPGGGMPMQPMARKADADNSVPRCPKCGTATTSYTDGIDGNGEHKGRCHSCGHIFNLKETHVILADLPNPTLQNAAEQHQQRPEDTQDSSLTWKDDQGQPLVVGQTYELHSPNYSVPDEVQVISSKPDALGLKLVGEFANIHSDDQTTDFTITPQQMDMEQYSFVSAGQDTDQAQGLGGTPGLEQIPQSGPTTDESSNSYPNPGTVSHVIAEVDDTYDNLCHKCGGDWIDHIASSPTTTMHECARCGSAWETNDNFQGKKANVDLDWLNEDSHGEDFHAQMQRAREMAEYGNTSRSLSSVAAKDHRLQAVKDVLERNKSDRERTAGRHFTPSEQRSLVNEKGTARNLDDLDLSNTHYTTRYDYTGKANGLNAPSEHLILGL